MSEQIVVGLDEIGTVVKKVQAKIEGEPRQFILLDGDLSSGKTTFVKHFVATHSDSTVTSPTFSLVHEYADNIFHYDLYQKSYEELVALGIWEYFDKEGLHFVEWASEKLREDLLAYHAKILTVQIQHRENKRAYIIS